MTDQELLAILAEKTPDELTEGEIHLLRQRLLESAELRDALLGQLQMDTYLATALARINFSPHDILLRAQGQDRSPYSIAAYIGIPLVIVALVAALFVFRDVINGRSRTPAVARGPKRLVDSTDPNSDARVQPQTSTANKPSGPTPQLQAIPAATGPVSNNKAVQPATVPADGDDPAQTPVAPPPVAAQPKTPWHQVLAQQENLPQFTEEAFRTFDVGRQLPRRTDLLPWFEAVPGHNHRIIETDTPRGRCAQLEGLARLKSPWTDDSALKLSLENYNKLQIHFFHGQEGVTLVYYEDQQYRWAAYATRRQPGKARPEQLALTATDDYRGQRSELRLGGPVEIRHRGGELIVSRGNIVLLAAPLSAAPEDVYFDGRVSFHGLELVRTQGDPQGLRSPPVVFETDRPADLAWATGNTDTARIEPQADGSIRLARENEKERVQCHTPLPYAGLCDVILELDEVTPGSSVFLGDDQGAIHQVLRFQLDRRTNQLAARVRGNDDAHEDQFEDFKERPSPLFYKHGYVRMLCGAGNFRCWLSSDGIHWGQVDAPSEGGPGNRRTLGLQLVANRPQAQLTLKRIVMRELNGLSGLAPQEVRSQAVAFPQARSLGQWLAEVSPLQPPGTDAAVWRRASAIRTLGAGAGRELAYPLLELLLDEAAAARLPIEQQLAALSDAMLLVTDLRDNGAMRVGLPSRYLQLARMAFDENGSPPWTAIQHAVMSVPLAAPLPQPLALEENLRWELIDTAARREPQEMLQLCRQLRFFHLPGRVPLIDWAESTARRTSPTGGGDAGLTRMKDGWRPPLVEEVSKETYSAMTDLQSLIDSQAWEDAAEAITLLPADTSAGVAPWPADKGLFVSLPTAVQLTLKREARLKETLETQFATLAELRISQAIAAGDAAAVELATVQFSGTQAAAEAHRWLGDRALVSGWFERAISEYDRALALSASLEAELAPRIRLAAALLGRDALSPPAESVRLGEISLTKEQFESLVAEMRGRTGTSLASASPFSGYSSDLLPPAALAAQTKARLDGNVGDKPQEEVVRRTNQFRVPWVDRQIATVLEGDILYVSNRFQLAAYNLASGQRLWQSPPPPGAMKPAQDWAMIAMRPLITATHIFVRQLYGSSPQLVCLNKQNGQIVWTAELTEREFLASDPLLVQGQLVALSVALAGEQEGMLGRSVFDPASGQLLEQRYLCRLRNSWGTHACCEVQALDDSLIAVLGGITLRVDSDGDVQWIRSQVVLPAEEEPRWILQLYQRPLVDGQRIYVAQPGVRAIDCLDARSGSRLWLAVLPDVIGISGLVGDKLIVRTEADLRALDSATGKTVWRHPAADLHSFQVCGPSAVLYARREPAQGTSALQTRFVWLDAATGNELGSTVIPQWTDADPRLGPIVPYKDRLWTFFGKGQHDPTRDLVELVPSGMAESPSPEPLAQDLWLRHVPVELAGATAKALPEWQILSGQVGDRTGLVPEAHGETNILGARCNPQWPIAVARQANFPPAGTARLRLRVGNDAGHHWKLEVRFGDQLVKAIDVTDEAFKDRWKTLEVDLSSLAGQSGTLVVSGIFVKGGGNQTVTFWKSAELLF